jgi:hypothetical protein
VQYAFRWWFVQAVWSVWPTAEDPLIDVVALAEATKAISLPSDDKAWNVIKHYLSKGGCEAIETLSQ